MDNENKFNAETQVEPGLVDWSTLHRPSPECQLYAPVKEAGDWKKYEITQSQIDQFWRDGYLLDVPILTPEQCDLMLEEYQFYTGGDCTHPGRKLLYEFHPSQTPDDPNNVLVHVLGHWRLTRNFHDAVFHPKIVVPCSQLVIEGRQNSAIRFWHDQLFAKPPRNGGVVAWHQDYSYWTRTQPQSHITVHLALDDQTEENGGLMYIPGSHRWTRNGKPLPVLDFNFKDMEGIKATLVARRIKLETVSIDRFVRNNPIEFGGKKEENVDTLKKFKYCASAKTILTPDELAAFKPQNALLKKGHASFHHSLTLHGSNANKSDSPRRAAVFNYFVDGVVSNTDNFLLCPDGDPKYHAAGNIPKGEKMCGQFYPLVYDPAWAAA